MTASLKTELESGLTPEPVRDLERPESVTCRGTWHRSALRRSALRSSLSEKPRVLGLLLKLSVVLLIWGVLAGPARGQEAPPPAPPPAAPLEEWAIRVATKEDGVFNYCGATNLYDNGLLFGVLRREGGEIAIAIAGARGFESRLGEKGPVKLQIDRRLRRERQFEVAQSDQLLIPLGQDEILFRALRAGSVLSIEIAEFEPKFSLKGTGIALAGLRECADARGGSSTPASDRADIAPSVPDGEAIATPSVPVDRGAIATPSVPAPPSVPVDEGAGTTPQGDVLPLPPIIGQVLHASGADAIVPLSLGDNGSVWGFGRIVGLVRHVKVRADQATNWLTERYLQNIEMECARDGQFSKLVNLPRRIPSGIVVTADASCTKGDDAIYISLLFYRTRQHDFAVFTYQADREGRTRARQQRDALRGIVEGITLEPQPAPTGSPATDSSAP